MLHIDCHAYLLLAHRERPSAPKRNTLTARVASCCKQVRIAEGSCRFPALSLDPREVVATKDANRCDDKVRDWASRVRQIEQSEKSE